MTWLAFLHSSDGKRVFFFFWTKKEIWTKTTQRKTVSYKSFRRVRKMMFLHSFCYLRCYLSFLKALPVPPRGLRLVEEKGSAAHPLLWLTDLLPVLTFLVREQRNDSKTEALAGRLQIIRVPPSTCSRPLWRSLWANGEGSLLWLLHRAAFFSPPFFSFSVRSLPSLFCSISSGASVCDQIPDKTNEIPLSLRCSLWLRLV